MIEKVKIFKDFKDRKEDLQKVTRYSLYPVMFYRTNLWLHSWHVYWITKILCKKLKPYYPELDQDRAEIMALVHDDHEIFLGDIQAGNKLMMNATEKAMLHQREIDAINQVAERFPRTVEGFSYRDLLVEAMNAVTLESHIVKLADRLDAFGEALHEIYGGNTVFGISVMHHRGPIPTPCDFYINWLQEVPKMYPEFILLWNKHDPFFEVPERFDWLKIAEKSLTHTEQTLFLKTGYPFYDAWKNLILENNIPEFIKALHNKTE